MEFLQLAFLVNLVLVTVLISNGQEVPSEGVHAFDGLPRAPDGLPIPSVPLARGDSGDDGPRPPSPAPAQIPYEELSPYEQQRIGYPRRQGYPPGPPPQHQHQQQYPAPPRGEESSYGPGPQDEEPPFDPDDDSPPPYVLSYVYLKHLAGVEEKLYPLMTDYAQALEKRLKIIKNYMKDYEDSSMRGTRHLRNTPENPQVKASAVASHPVMAYRVVRRFSNEMKALEREFERGHEKVFTRHLTKLEGRHKWPGMYEHEQAMAGVLRVHYIYDMDIKQFSSGIIGGIDTGVGLTAKQTFHIAKFATYTNYYTLAMAWLGATSWKLRNATNCDDCKEISANTLAMAYRNNIEKHNEELAQGENSTNMYMYTERIETDTLPQTLRNMHLSHLKDQNFSLTEVDVNAVRNYAAPNPDLLLEQEDEEEAEELDPEEEAAVEQYNAILELRSHFNYITLCNGQSTQTEAEKAKLYCWYERRKHPYWYINPLKMELLNPEPFLVQMYEFISDKWIQYLIKKATPISNAPPPPSPEATPRSAAYAWLRDEDIDEIPLSLRIEHITGLHVRGQEASTDLQIASYVSGGHVANHVDSLGEGNDPRGDRVTTFLIYLNDVERGGYTAYPLLGTFVKPIKGSAILWYDSLKNGQIDNRMLHGACPPILGNKWIATKWTHLNENFLNRPCDLDSDV